MPISIDPEGQQLAVYVIGAAVLLIVLFNIPYVGRVLRALFSCALLAFCLFMLFERAPFEPSLARVMRKLGLDGQSVSGKELRIRMSPDGHFWAQVSINGVERRMLIDSGATITALSERTARSAHVDHGGSLLPIVMRTANGSISADTGTIRQLTLANISAENLRVLVSPALGDVDVLGMNFLSQLASWRVEGRTLIMVPSVPSSGTE